MITQYSRAVNHRYPHALRIIEKENHTLEMVYVYTDPSPFRSPVVVERVFHSWLEAITFLQIWEMLGKIHWGPEHGDSNNQS